ncbi:MAG TPA: DUF5317 domain-containing protein [Ilumatobacteraceae bacterium]|nr:DUF5317 domain-containing protein [Ilumatobacteraceae bacterium]
MIIVVASIAAILTVPLTGRSLAPLAKLSLRRVWLVWLSIGLQLVITLIAGFPNWLGQPVHLLTFGLSAAFLWSNRHLPGALLVGLGAGLNFAAIAANGGTMPASPWAWRVSGLPTITGEFENSHIASHARLWWLGDVFAIPKGWPFANVFSVGDVIIVVAIAYFAHAWCRRADSVDAAGAAMPPVLATAD